MRQLKFMTYTEEREPRQSNTHRQNRQGKTTCYQFKKFCVDGKQNNGKE